MAAGLATRYQPQVNITGYMDYNRQIVQTSRDLHDPSAPPMAEGAHNDMSLGDLTMGNCGESGEVVQDDMSLSHWIIQNHRRGIEGAHTAIRWLHNSLRDDDSRASSTLSVQQPYQHTVEGNDESLTFGAVAASANDRTSLERNAHDTEASIKTGSQGPTSSPPR